METNPDFDKYMDHYFDYFGQWDSPSRCGLKIVKRKDGKTLAIATEIYRQNPGTPVTEWVAPLATQIMRDLHCDPADFVFVEHTPNLHSKLTFYGETFDIVRFELDGSELTDPKWTRLTSHQVDAMMEE
ncbi:MAG: hypothetical protein M0Q38_09605 [Bacteroidales bacterium]|jgi:hypothetical protein|nr:hypothetical protein [Bacteroidales bacterium]